MTFWVKKTRPQNTMIWPQNVGNRISEDLNFRGCSPNSPTGERLRRSYYRTPFCESLDPPQTLTTNPWNSTILYARNMSLGNNRIFIRRGISRGISFQQRSCFGLLCLFCWCACTAFASHDSPSHCVPHTLHVLHDVIPHVWHVPHGDKRRTARGRGWGGIHVWLVWEDVVMSDGKDEHLNAHQEIL